MLVYVGGGGHIGHLIPLSRPSPKPVTEAPSHESLVASQQKAEITTKEALPPRHLSSTQTYVPVIDRVPSPVDEKTPCSSTRLDARSFEPPLLRPCALVYCYQYVHARSDQTRLLDCLSWKQQCRRHWTPKLSYRHGTRSLLVATEKSPYLLPQPQPQPFSSVQVHVDPEHLHLFVTSTPRMKKTTRKDDASQVCRGG